MTEEPLYNIGIVTRLTGISIATLHAWERRYGYLKPTRTPGGHRLYSEKDIARLRWVKSQLDSGLSASRAIHVVQSLEDTGRLFLPENSPPAEGMPKFTPASLQDQLLEALLANEIPFADRLLGDTLAFYTPEDLTMNIIAPVMARIGEAWEKDKLNIATEHLATNYLRHRLLMWMVTGPTPRSIKPVILACAPGEWHEGSLLIFGVLLRRRGWPVAYLGQNVPLQSLSDFAERINPSAILLVAMRTDTAWNLVEWPGLIKQVAGNPPILLGGRAFIIESNLKQQVPGIYLGDTIQEGILKMESILQGTITLGIPIHNPQ